MSTYLPWAKGNKIRNGPSKEGKNSWLERAYNEKERPVDAYNYVTLNIKREGHVCALSREAKFVH